MKTTNAAAVDQPAGRRGARAVARQRGLVERAGGEVEAHPDRDEREAPAAVGERVVEEDVHRPRAEHEQPERDRAREPGDRQHRDADRARELGGALARLQPGEVREQRALDRLEELQRRPRDQQHVEHEARHRCALRRPVDQQHAGVEQRLLGHHDRQHREREAPAAREPERLLVRAPLTGRHGPARERPRHHDERHERRRRHAERDRRLALRDPHRHRDREGQPRARLQEHEPAVEPEPLVPRQPAAREVARRVGQHRDDEDPVERRRAVEQVVLDRALAAPARPPGSRARSPPGSASACAAGGRPRSRAPAGRRSSATAAARSAGR